MVSATFTIPRNPPDHGQRSGGSNAGLTLQAYVAGQENRLVHWALKKLETRTLQVNPLTFFGPTTIGKSTLLRGIELHWNSLSSKQALLIHGADYARSYAHAVETNAVDEFRNKYQQQGLVLIDDLQSLADKPAAQQEFVNLVERRLETAAPIIISLNTSLAEQTRLSAVVLSRLAGGTQIQLHPPLPPTRRVILDQLLEQAGIDFPSGVRETLCGQRHDLASPFSTVSEIRHAVLQLYSATTAQGSLPSLSDAADLINREVAARKPTLAVITKEVARYFKVKVSDLKSSSRRQWVVRARGVAFYLARQLTRKSFGELGKHLGGRDHTTVMHACRRTKSLLESDPAISDAVRKLEQRLLINTNNCHGNNAC